jgi:hypothetical protein
MSACGVKDPSDALQRISPFCRLIRKPACRRADRIDRVNGSGARLAVISGPRVSSHPVMIERASGRPVCLCISALGDERPHLPRTRCHSGC